MTELTPEQVAARLVVVRSRKPDTANKIVQAKLVKRMTAARKIEDLNIEKGCV